MMGTMECPDGALLNRLLAGTLSSEREQTLSAHLDQCAKCRERLERAAASDRTLTDVARNLRGSVELSDSMKRVIEKCTSDPDIVLVDAPVRKVERGASRLDRTVATADVAAFTVQPGMKLGRYEILEEIGRGGMGTVWKARDPGRDEFVAIKVLDSQVAADQTARRRFLREARAVGAVDHQNVVARYGVEEYPAPYIVMEYVDGPSLKTYLARKGALDLKTVLRFGLQIANGLAASHAKRITHRDIKPANIVIERATGRAKLTDFGLAHIEGDIKLTMQGFVTGTPAYMSPEQAMGDPIDHRSDLFSLGSVLYTMSTGRSPFDDEKTLAALDRVCTTEPTLPEDLNPAVSAQLSELIKWLHAKRPHNRPQTAVEVALLLKDQLETLESTSGGDFVQVSKSGELDEWIQRGMAEKKGSSTRMTSIARDPAPTSQGRQIAAMGAAVGLVLLVWLYVLFSGRVG